MAENSSSTWGGRRDGAGRPKSSELVSHLSRPEIEKKHAPVLITLKLRSKLPSLRSPDLYLAFEKGALRARRFGLRIIEYSVYKTKVRLICEFKTKEELERSFKSLNTTLAIAIKKSVFERTKKKHEGPIFLGRYHLEVLSTPDEMKIALRKLLVDEVDPEHSGGTRDPYSSAVLFERWRALLGSEFKTIPLEATQNDRDIATRITATPQFWLSQAGWLKAQKI